LCVCSFYNELRRFRISIAAAVAKDGQGLAQFDSKHGLVQIIADNFDTQILSQNGQVNPWPGNDNHPSQSTSVKINR